MGDDEGAGSGHAGGDGGTDVDGRRDDNAGSGAADPLAAVLGDVRSCPGSIRDLVAHLLRVADEPLTGGLGVGPALEAGVIALGRARQLLDAEVGRRVVAAETADALRYSAATTLQRSAGWAGPTPAIWSRWPGWLPATR